MERSLERPLVSGFYRLVTLVFNETSKSGYFDPDPLPPSTTSDGVGNTETPTIISVADALGDGTGLEMGRAKVRHESGGGSTDAEEGVGNGGRGVCRRVLCR